MGLFNKSKPQKLNKYELELITVNAGGQFVRSGKLFESDIVKSCIRAKARAMGKIEAKHIRTIGNDIQINPEPYIKQLLINPNPLMTGKQYREKMITQLELNGNAFAWIMRDGNGLPIGRYPIDCTHVKAMYDSGEIMIEFYLTNGKRKVYPYRDIIHYRHDYNSEDLFGDSPAEALTKLMSMFDTIDTGLINAVENGRKIRFLLKYAIPKSVEKLKEDVSKFKQTFMDSADETYGFGAIDSTTDIKDLNSKDYVPNSQVLEQEKKRILNLFGTNEKIISSSFTEDEWNSYYEACIEPDALEMAAEDTRKLFSIRDAENNQIVYESSNLSCASFNTRIALQAMVDRGALTPNEWRAVFNRAPLPGGDEPIRRLDTEVVNLANRLLDAGADAEKIMKLLSIEV